MRRGTSAGSREGLRRGARQTRAGRGNGAAAARGYSTATERQRGWQQHSGIASAQPRRRDNLLKPLQNRTDYSIIIY